jgi:hypothetical protein
VPLQIYDSGQVRIEQIFQLIEGCRFGIHDISRTELDPGSNLPRFNTPLELGIFLGALRFGSGVHRRKTSLIVDRERYRYQRFISDISGQDTAAHNNDPRRLIAIVRDWLSTAASGEPSQGPRPTSAANAFKLRQACASFPLSRRHSIDTWKKPDSKKLGLVGTAMADADVERRSSHAEFSQGLATLEQGRARGRSCLRGIQPDRSSARDGDEHPLTGAAPDSRRRMS